LGGINRIENREKKGTKREGKRREGNEGGIMRGGYEKVGGKILSSIFRVGSPTAGRTIRLVLIRVD
jgi:hypothetical protein